LNIFERSCPELVCGELVEPVEGFERSCPELACGELVEPVEGFGRFRLTYLA